MTTACLARRAAADPHNGAVLVNVLAFQAGWWTVVLSAARDHAAVGLLVVALVLAWHLARVRPGRAEAALIAGAAMIGLGAMTLVEPLPALLALAAGWAVLTPLLFRLAAWLEARPWH